MTRRCGNCTLCCRVLPVNEGLRIEAPPGASVELRQAIDINAMLPRFVKPAGQRCQHQCSTGCKIYEKRPVSCKLFACGWLLGVDTDGLQRPDHAHYVIDTTVDMVGVNGKRIYALQIWVDRREPDRWLKDAGLHRWMERRAAEDFVFIIRYDDKLSRIVLPPAHSPTGTWMLSEPQQANIPMFGLPEETNEPHQRDVGQVGEVPRDDQGHGAVAATRPDTDRGRDPSVS